MAETYRGTRARVRKVIFPLDGELAWRASVPGECYPLADGLHFDTWRDAMDYVLYQLRDGRRG